MFGKEENAFVNGNVAVGVVLFPVMQLQGIGFITRLLSAWTKGLVTQIGAKESQLRNRQAIKIKQLWEDTNMDMLIFWKVLMNNFKL